MKRTRRSSVDTKKWNRLKEMSDNELAFTARKMKEDLKEYGGTEQEWSEMRSMREICADRFIHMICDE